MEKRIMESRIQEIRTELLLGDNSFLAKVFTECEAYCKGFLVNKKSCPQQDVSDIYNEAILVLRENILKGKIQELTNLKSYLVGICLNIHYQSINKSKRIGAKEETVRLHFYEMNYSIDENQEYQIELMKEIGQRSLDSLDKKCYTLLKLFYFDALSMKEISEFMGFASANVAKTMKSRCYKKLMGAAQNLIKKVQ